MCVRPDGDLLVGDPIQQRANVFSRTGEFVAVVNLTGDAAFPSIQGCFADGTYLGWRSASPRDRVPGTIIQARFTWSRVAADGGRIADLVTLPASPRYLLDQDDGTATYHTVPFTASPSAAAFGRYLHVAPGGPALIEKRRLNGSIDAHIRWTPTLRPKSADVYDRYRNHVLESQEHPERRSHWARFFDLDIDLPEHIAAVQDLLVDDSGNVWAERYRLPWNAAVWDVFDGDGRWIVAVEMPAGFRLFQVGADYVLGLARDELGIERVEVRPLAK